MWNGTMFVDLDLPLNASSLLSASAELLVEDIDRICSHQMFRIQKFTTQNPRTFALTEILLSLF